MRIINTPKTIQKRITEALIKKANKKIKDKTKEKFNQVISNVKDLIAQKIRDGKTYKSLQDGILKRDFGLDEESFLIFDSSIHNLYDVNFSIEESDSDPDSVFSLKLYVSELEEGDARIESIIRSTSYISKRSGERIEWLRWLMYRRVSRINKSWKVYPKEGHGRSGLGIMITSYKKNFTYSVNKDYAGKYGDNFVSKAIKSAQEDIKKILPGEQK